MAEAPSVAVEVANTVGAGDAFARKKAADPEALTLYAAPMSMVGPSPPAGCNTTNRTAQGPACSGDLGSDHSGTLATPKAPNPPLVFEVAGDNPSSCPPVGI